MLRGDVGDGTNPQHRCGGCRRRLTLGVRRAPLRTMSKKYEVDPSCSFHAVMRVRAPSPQHRCGGCRRRVRSVTLLAASQPPAPCVLSDGVRSQTPGGCRIMMRLELQWGCFSQGLYTPRGPRPPRTNKLRSSSSSLYYYCSPPLSTLIFILSFILFML